MTRRSSTAISGQQIRSPLIITRSSGAIPPSEWSSRKPAQVSRSFGIDGRFAHGTSRPPQRRAALYPQPFVLGAGKLGLDGCSKSSRPPPTLRFSS